jgi:hypothetical protein
MLAWGKVTNLLNAAVVILLFTLVTCPTSFAQGPIPEARMDFAAFHASAFVSVPQPDAGQHKFWDKHNELLFVTAAALNGADFAVTRSNLQSGGRELNPIVRVLDALRPRSPLTSPAKPSASWASAISSTRQAITNSNVSSP